jgi:hypothetical protein
MRARVDRERLLAFLQALGAEAGQGTRAYLVGGATAVLRGWRSATVDIDLRIEPDGDAALRALPGLKERLSINIELASPADFLPELPGWRERSAFVGQFGGLAVFHYDAYAQALAKLERDHTTDRADVAAMLERGLIEPRRLRELFEAIAPEFYRFPAVDVAGFRRRVTQLRERGDLPSPA